MFKIKFTFTPKNLRCIRRFEKSENLFTKSKLIDSCLPACLYLRNAAFLVHAVKIVSDQNKGGMVWRWKDYRRRVWRGRDWRRRGWRDCFSLIKEIKQLNFTVTCCSMRSCNTSADFLYLSWREKQRPLFCVLMSIKEGCAQRMGAMFGQCQLVLEKCRIKERP